MAKKCVLVVDPDPDARIILTRLLDVVGYHSCSAESCATGLQLAKQLQPDLIIAAVTPCMRNGSPFVEALRADLMTRDLRVLGTTTMPSDDNVDGALRSGCTRVVAKPLTFAVLLREVEALLGPRPPAL